MKRNITILTLAATILTLSPALAGDTSRRRAVQPPTARVIGKVGVIADVQREAGVLRVPVSIDLRGVTIEAVPAVLGAYVVKADFDPNAVRYVQTKGGSTPQFMEPPIATNPELANDKGYVKIAAVQSDHYAPVGQVSIAAFEFQELIPGGASTIRVSIDSVAAAATPDSNGKIPVSLELPIKGQ